jgi:arginyl-tRNA synthetase
VLFACLEKLKLIDKKKLTHLGYGLVNLPDGRMKSREGNVVDADNLMDELSSQAEEKLKERNKDIEEKIARNNAEMIMNAAWKFTLLKTSTKKSITFDAEESMRFDGASGPYVQYSAVRIKALLGKYNVITNSFKVSKLGEAEKPLARKILEYQKAVSEAAKKQNPTYVVTYLLELAQEWNRYYAETNILKAETETTKARVAFAEKVLSVFESGLNCLSISVPDVM